MRASEMATAGRRAAVEADALEQVRDAFANAVTAVRATVGVRPE